MEITLRDAYNRMKEFTKAGIPFRLEYFTMSGKHKVCENAIGRHGFTKRQSKRARFLIAYTDTRSNEHRQFHRALIISINNQRIRRSEEHTSELQSRDHL